MFYFFLLYSMNMILFPRLGFQLNYFLLLLAGVFMNLFVKYLFLQLGVGIVPYHDHANSEI